MNGRLVVHSIGDSVSDADVGVTASIAATDNVLRVSRLDGAPPSADDLRAVAGWLDQGMLSL